MSNGQGLDAFTTIDEKLRELVNLSKAEASDKGLIETDAISDIPDRPNEFASVNYNGERFPVPQGITSFDFSSGNITNNKFASTMSVPLRTMDDMSRGLTRGSIQKLRSLYISVDVPMTLGFQHDHAETKEFRLQPFRSYVFTKDFKAFHLHADYPGTLEAVVSTRTYSFKGEMASPDIIERLDETRSLSDKDTYESFYFYPKNLRTELNDIGVGLGVPQQQPFIPAGESNHHTFVVRNTSGNGNAMDFKVVGTPMSGQTEPSATYHEAYVDIIEETGVADGDEHLFTVEGCFPEIACLLKSNAGGGVQVEGDAYYSSNK